MDLDATECLHPGIKNAFPAAKIHPRGLSIEEMPEQRIAAIGIKNGFIKNERIHFTTCLGEEVNLKLLCREHLQSSTSVITLQLRDTSDKLQDVALVKFIENQHATRHPTFSAVCIGLLLSKWDNSHEKVIK